MSFWNPSLADDPTRTLARSLLWEALGLPMPGAVRCDAPVALVSPPPRVFHKRGTWDRPRCLTAVQTFLARHRRDPTKGDWRNPGRHGLPTPTTVRRYWESEAACVAEAWREVV
jgi:hypothetical protein